MKNQRGFTLLELMVVVAMVAIIATLSAPSWQNFVVNRRIAGASREIYNALQHARMMAIKEGKTITVLYYKDGVAVSGAGNHSKKHFDKAVISWNEYGGGSLETREIFKAPKNIQCDTNQNSMAYNSRGILLATNQGMVRAWSSRTKRECSVIINNLGTLRPVSGTHL